MKQNLILLSLVLMTIFFLGCKKEVLVHKSEFEKSHKEWLIFKKSSKNSYKYVVEFASWAGFREITTLTVENGKVVARDFMRILNPNSPGQVPENELEWTETVNELNSHSSGAATITLDEVYDKARNHWLIKRGNAKTFFEAKNNGLISSCGYTENNCADDCFRGIDITSIKPLIFEGGEE